MLKLQLAKAEAHAKHIIEELFKDAWYQGVQFSPYGFTISYIPQGINEEMEVSYPLEYLELTAEEIDAKEREYEEVYKQKEKERNEEYARHRLPIIIGDIEHYRSLLSSYLKEFERLTGKTYEEYKNG